MISWTLSNLQSGWHSVFAWHELEVKNLGSIRFLVRGDGFRMPSNVIVLPSSFLVISRIHVLFEVENSLMDNPGTLVCIFRWFLQILNDFLIYFLTKLDFRYFLFCLFSKLGSKIKPISISTMIFVNFISFSLQKRNFRDKL